jgi:hypothetical protein
MELAISVCNIFSSQSGGFFKLSDNYAAARKITRRPSQNRQHYLNFLYTADGSTRPLVRAAAQITIWYVNLWPKPKRRRITGPRA